MFETKKTLIVVYKDELLVNQLKKLVETHDDTEQSVVGTRDDSVNIVSWTEKVWLANKAAGNLRGKILFLGDVKGTDELTPIIDVKFDEYGVKFGWAGNQAVVFADTKVLTTREDYDAFLDKLSALPVPDFLKADKESIATTGTDQQTEEAYETALQPDDESDNSDQENSKKVNILKAAKKAVTKISDVTGKVSAKVAIKSEELFRNKSLMKRQMLFYGVVNMYNDWLEKFMNL